MTCSVVLGGCRERPTCTCCGHLAAPRGEDSDDARPDIAAAAAAASEAPSATAVMGSGNSFTMLKHACAVWVESNPMYKEYACHISDGPNDKYRASIYGGASLPISAEPAASCKSGRPEGERMRTDVVFECAPAAEGGGIVPNATHNATAYRRAPRLRVQRPRGALAKSGLVISLVVAIALLVFVGGLGVYMLMGGSGRRVLRCLTSSLKGKVKSLDVVPEEEDTLVGGEGGEGDDDGKFGDDEDEEDSHKLEEAAMHAEALMRSRRTKHKPVAASTSFGVLGDDDDDDDV